MTSNCGVSRSLINALLTPQGATVLWRFSGFLTNDNSNPLTSDKRQVKTARPATIVLALLLCACVTEQGPRITNYESSGNLQALEPIRCVDLSDITNNNTPADIFPGVEDCMNRKDYLRAAKLYALGGLYGRVDQLRVADQSAHQAVTVLQINHLGSLATDERDALQNSIASIAGDPGTLKAMCAEIRALGPPNYYPAYMVQHGMGAFLGRKSGPLTADFQMAEAWEKSLSGFLRCP